MDVSGFSLHLAYDELELPRMGDQNVADMFMSYTDDKETLMALQRVSASLNVLFLSDVVTADGKVLQVKVVGHIRVDGVQQICLKIHLKLLLQPL